MKGPPRRALLTLQGSRRDQLLRVTAVAFVLTLRFVFRPTSFRPMASQSAPVAPAEGEPSSSPASPPVDSITTAGEAASQGSRKRSRSVSADDNGPLPKRVAEEVKPSPGAESPAVVFAYCVTIGLGETNPDGTPLSAKPTKKVPKTKGGQGALAAFAAKKDSAARVAESAFDALVAKNAAKARGRPVGAWQ